MTEEKAKFEEWAILELLGHVRLAGKVSEHPMFGTNLGRIDIPKRDHGFTTMFFGGSSVYRLTPCSEDVARMVALHNEPEPVHRWELPAPAPSRMAAAIDIATDDRADELNQCQECGAYFVNGECPQCGEEEDTERSCFSLPRDEF